jgi:hypothetical protein
VRRFLVLAAIVLWPVAARGLGLEVEGYPAGVIVGGTHAWPLGDQGTVATLAGWNFTDRRDWGEHDDEHGGGPGVGVAASRWLGAGRAGWGIGVRTDLWWLDVDWEEAGRSGTTEIVVLQPTVRAGYAWHFDSRDTRLDVSVSLGAEINVAIDGEEVGDGAILLLGIGVAR